VAGRPAFILLNCEAIKTGIFGQPELFDPKLMHLNFDPGVENCPELVLLTVPNFREYLYTKIRLSTPALSALLTLAGQICLWYVKHAKALDSRAHRYVY
jgi:hypothetical protein